MDTGFIIYQKRLGIWNVLLPHWKSEVITAKFLEIILIIILAYIIWWKLTDKRRLKDLLLYGSLITVMETIIDAYGVEAGLWINKIHVFPMGQSFLVRAFTITPLTMMLVQQYSSNWSDFFIWNAVGCGFIAFVVQPGFSALGIIQLMNWNYIYTFSFLYIASLLSRGAFHLIGQVQNKAIEGVDNPLQNTLLNPAFKPLDRDKDDSKK